MAMAQVGAYQQPFRDMKFKINFIKPLSGAASGMPGC